MIHHVTYHVPMGTLENSDLKAFMGILGFEEIDANDLYEHGWRVRWFRDIGNSRALPIHFVENDDPNDWDALMLGHFCVEAADVDFVHAAAQRFGWLERASGSGRIWLKLANLRVEVRS